MEKYNGQLQNLTNNDSKDKSLSTEDLAKLQNLMTQTVLHYQTTVIIQKPVTNEDLLKIINEVMNCGLK